MNNWLISHFVMKRKVGSKNTKKKISYEIKHIDIENIGAKSFLMGNSVNKRLFSKDVLLNVVMMIIHPKIFVVAICTSSKLNFEFCNSHTLGSFILIIISCKTAV